LSHPAGSSLRDVQELAGHASLATTQRYIQGDTEAKRKVIHSERRRGYSAAAVAVWFYRLWSR
jgi:integrase/recombinase XerD